jgi:hypothetical protein
MELLAKLIARHNKTETSKARSQPDARRPPGIRAKFGAVAVAVAAVAASFAVIAPTPAYADTNGVQILSGRSGLRADVMWASTDAFQGVFLWPANSSASQVFDLLDSGNGFFRMRARHSGQCLMLDGLGWADANGTRLIQYPSCAAGFAQAEWYTQDVWRPSDPCGDPCFGNGGWYQLIRNRGTGRCLDADNPAGGMPGQQAVLQQWDCISSTTQWNAWNQLWTVSVPIPIH